MSQRLWDSLTAREKEVALKIAEVDKYQAIAQELGMPFFTVRSHARRIYAKLGTRNKIELTLAVLQGVGR